MDSVQSGKPVSDIFLNKDLENTSCDPFTFSNLDKFGTINVCHCCKCLFTRDNVPYLIKCGHIACEQCIDTVVAVIYILGITTVLLLYRLMSRKS